MHINFEYKDVSASKRLEKMVAERLNKLEDKYDGPYTITDVHVNGTVRIQRGTVNERVNIRRITPYFE